MIRDIQRKKVMRAVPLISKKIHDYGKKFFQDPQVEFI